VALYIVGNPAPASNEWADVYGDHSGIEAGISVDRRRYGIRAPTLSGWHPEYLQNGSSPVQPYNPAVVGNGAVFTRLAGTSFDGVEPEIELRPPTIGFNAENQPGDAKILASNLYRGGLNSIAQINIRVVARFGASYFNLAAETKWDGVLCAPNNNQPGSAANGRAGIFTQKNPPGTGNQFFAVTSGTVQTYNFPPEGFSCDVGPIANKLLRMAGSPNHAASPPQIGGPTDYVCLEHVVDCRQDRGNAFGMNKLYLWTRDGVVNGRFLRIDLTWGPWNFTNGRFITTYEGLGFYFNTVSTAHPDNWARYSHWTIAANLNPNEVIGPPW
jgi:hypothetical protein